MSGESLTSQDKEELKRRLELLQKEYERTAARLQRAERREAVRKHVQNTISEQNRLLHCNTFAISESSSSTPEPISNCSLPPDTNMSPFSSLRCKQSPYRSHRLRSKRSRLRLQIREKESDTEESQDKMREEADERWREKCGLESTSEEKDVETGHTEEDIKAEESNRDGTEKLTDKLSQNEKELTNQLVTECSSVHQSPLPELLKVHDSPADQSALSNSPSASSDHSVPSDGSFIQSCSDNADNKGPGCSYYLNSCTVIEGLPFPVEYYVRTTRRMASAHSHVDLNAVIQSQLSKGRGRRRSSRGRVTAQPPSEKPVGKTESRKRGARGRGCKRTRKSDWSVQSDSFCSSPTALIQEEPQPIISPEPSLDSTTVSLLHFSREPTFRNPYPIFRKRCRETGVSLSQIHANIDVSSHLLPSLTSLAQTMSTNMFPNLSRSLMISDVQDFHLPDDEFGQLKLQRLRSACLGVESLVYSVAFRKNRSASVSEDGHVEEKKRVLPLPHGSSMDKNLAMMFTEELHESANQSEHRITSETLDRTQEPVGLIQSCITNCTEIQQSYGGTECPHTLFASRSVMLNFSLSLTSHTQIDHNRSFISLGASPNQLTVPPSPQLTPFLSLPANQEVASEQSYHDNQECAHLSVNDEVHLPVCETSEHFIRGLDRESPSSDQTSDILLNSELKMEEKVDSDKREGIEVNSPKRTNVLICSETERQYPVSPAPPLDETRCPPTYAHSTPNDSSLSPNDPCLPNDLHLPPNDLLLSPNDSLLPPNDHSFPPRDPCLLPRDPCLLPSDPCLLPSDPCLLPGDPRLFPSEPSLPPYDPCLPPNECPNHLESKLLNSDTAELYTASDLEFLSQTSTPGNNKLNNETSVLPGVSADQREEEGVVASALNLKTTESNHGDSPNEQVALLSCGSLRKTYSLKALDGGCVLDVCLLQWPAGDWCVCVAGEWSVGVWKQNSGAQQWRLLYTWTFTQSVISLQSVPDSTALLCVCLGRLEITEARILCCPGTDGEFSQVDLYNGGLQAVLAVSDDRVTCCSSSGSRQNLQVFKLSQDGRIAGSLCLVPTDEPVQTLVLVEREKDALIGWTENKRLLIWNMKTGQLLQTVCLVDSVSMATCLRGYSYRGVLCVLLQQVTVCHEETSSLLFSLIALNPVTGKYFTLRNITAPSSPSERLIDGDVCESALVGVFQSGLTVWDLTGGVACLYENQPAEVCRLARWAGPNTLLTGYLSGDVHIYQFSPFTVNKTECNGV